jgi:hypothetical protein
MRILAFALMALAWACGTALAASRVALVIGNSIYAHVPRLNNPENDAKAIGEVLVRLGFEVSEETDLDVASLNRALRDFAKLSRNAEMAVIYYAGHAIVVDAQNFLIPTDAVLASDGDVEFETVPLDQMNRAVAGASALGLVLVDACRDNPFTRNIQGKRLIGNSFAATYPNPGTLVLLTSQTSGAPSGCKGQHSPMAAAILAGIEDPGIELSTSLRQIRDQISLRSGQRITLEGFGSLPEHRIYFSLRHPGPQSGIDDAIAAELAFWSDVKDSGDVARLTAYTDRFENGRFTFQANALVAGIREQDQKTALNNARTRCNLLAEDTNQTDKATAGTSNLTAQSAIDAIAACRTALQADPLDAKFYYQLARALYVFGNRRESMRMARRSADGGYALAQYNLGIAYLKGESLGKNPVEAVALLRQASQKGHMLAQYALAVLHHRGEDVARDLPTAAHYYKLAAEQGKAEAQSALTGLCAEHTMPACR